MIPERRPHSPRYRVDDLIVDTGRAEVTRHNELISLPKLSFDLLVALVNGAPEVVTADALLRQVWPGLIVSPETVSQRVKLLRDALGDDSKQPRYILVVRGRGFRLIPTPERVPEESAVRAAPALEPQGSPVAENPGEVTVPAVPPDPVPEGRPRQMWHRSWWTAGVSILLAIVMGVGVFFWRHPPVRLAVRAPDSKAVPQNRLPDNTIAVLPFQELGTGGDFLGAGISDSIRTRLGGVPQLSIISANSSDAYNGKSANPMTIGRELNARYLLEGSLQRSAESIRVTARLVNAETAADVWSVVFDRESSHIFAVQDEIANKVAQALRVTLRLADDRHRGGVGTNNLDAYLEYAQARSLLATLKAPNIVSSIEHFRRASALDPAFSAAYSGTADALSKLSVWGNQQENNNDEKAIRAAIDKALELDANNAEAYWVLADTENDDTKRQIYVQKAVALAPNTARANFELAMSVDLRAAATSPTAVDDQLMHLSKAMELDPLEPRYPRSKGITYAARRTGEIDKAEQLLLRSLELDPSYQPSLIFLAEFRAFAQSRYADAIKIFEDALLQDPDLIRLKESLAHVYLATGDLAAVDNVVAGSTSKTSIIWSLVAHQRYKEAAKLYDNNRSIASEDDIGPALFAVYMDAVQSHQYARGLRILGESAAIKWAGDGTPIPQVAMFSTMDNSVQYAHLLQLSGDGERGRKILEMVLASMDLTAGEYKRGEFWFSVPRANALALLERDEEALHRLEQAADHGMNYDWWQTAISPMYIRLRNNPRFRAYVSGQRQRAETQMELVRKMRADGEIPNRG